MNKSIPQHWTKKRTHYLGLNPPAPPPPEPPDDILEDEPPEDPLLVEPPLKLRPDDAEPDDAPALDPRPDDAFVFEVVPPDECELPLPEVREPSFIGEQSNVVARKLR